MTDHSAQSVIRTKRDGGTLSGEQISWFIAGYTEGTVADEQASALLMAIFLNGMNAAEISAWTSAIIDSGTRIDLSGIEAPTVDKHSTGGVGDKVSLPLCAIVAACGATVPQLSGRGLGHTGGTLDKLESIPGWRAELTGPEFVEQLQRVGAVICAAGDDLAPADRLLYALRDVTATVESIPLIAGSIMSKKIADGTSSLVLDVKTGSGAFLPDPASARELAATMLRLGTDHGVATSALITDMDQPLGRAVGNAVEVTESIEVLEGGGPPDLVELTMALADEMLALSGLDTDPREAVASGAAMDKWREMIAAQGGDPDAPLPAADRIEVIVAPVDGYVDRIDARLVGEAAWRLGAGRARKEDPVSATAGVICRSVAGDRVRAGDPVLELHVDDPDALAPATALLEGAVSFSDERPPPRRLIHEVIRP